MKKWLFSGILITVLTVTSTVCAYAKSSNTDSYTMVKNKLFAVAIPKDLKGQYKTRIKKDTISFFHKESEKAGFGGFAFAIRAYKNPADHAVLPGSRKIGELTDKKGILYDIVLKHPTDVQYDYTKSTEAPDTFKTLYKLGDVADVRSVKGTKYHKAQGTKGEYLYKDTLKKHIELINKNLDSNQLENENISYMYNVLAQGNKNVLDKVGYTYYDLNADGIDELIIGEIADGDWKGVIYDIYTMVNRKPKHVISGGARNRYYACDGTFICNEYSSGAGESGLRTYILIENSTELFPQVSFKYDSYTNKEKPWFISYGSDINKDEWESMDEKDFKERKSVFERYERFDYTPLSTVK